MTAIQQRDLHGLKALVTGATSGLGRAIAFQLARDGADVTVHGRDATRGVQTVEEIHLQGGRARFVAADLTDAASIARFAKEVGDGDCAYYSVSIGGERSLNAVWTYETPYPAVAEIRGHLAFYPERVDAIEERPEARMGGTS